MHRVRTCAAVGVWLCIALALSACGVFDALEPPPLSTAFNPLPPPPAPPVPGSVGPPTPEQAQSEIVQWFHKAGYKDFQIQALVEHARTESGFRACARGPGGYNYTFQWSGTRLQQLQEFAHTSGCPQLRAQLAFADKELKGSAKFHCFWDATTEPAAYAALRRGFGAGSC